MKRSVVAVALVLTSASVVNANESSRSIPSAKFDPPSKDHKEETIVFAGGCFWGVQSVFQHVRGVKNAVSGYAGGDKEKAHYDLVGNGNTGHAESVEVTYDPAIITTGQLMRIFFSVAHDPTQLNRQGPDEGNQYRSEIFTRNENQERVAREFILQLTKAGVFNKPIVTKVERNNNFYPAEAYHQDYAFLHPDKPYIIYNDLPKVKNLELYYPQFFRNDPILAKNHQR